MRRNSAKLSYRHKVWLFAITILIYGSGVVWAYLHHFARRMREFGEQPHPAEAWSLKLHGAATMAILVILGTLLPTHVRFAWHARRNRPKRHHANLGLRFSHFDRLWPVLLRR